MSDTFRRSQGGEWHLLASEENGTLVAVCGFPLPAKWAVRGACFFGCSGCVAGYQRMLREAHAREAANDRGPEPPSGGAVALAVA